MGKLDMHTWNVKQFSIEKLNKEITYIRISDIIGRNGCKSSWTWKWVWVLQGILFKYIQFHEVSLQ